MHGCDEEHFVMNIKQVKNKIAKTDNKMDMSFYNLRSKKYTKENK